MKKIVFITLVAVIWGCFSPESCGMQRQSHVPPVSSGISFQYFYDWFFKEILFKRPVVYDCMRLVHKSAVERLLKDNYTDKVLGPILKNSRCKKMLQVVKDFENVGYIEVGVLYAIFVVAEFIEKNEDPYFNTWFLPFLVPVIYFLSDVDDGKELSALFYKKFFSQVNTLSGELGAISIILDLKYNRSIYTKFFLDRFSNVISNDMFSAIYKVWLKHSREFSIGKQLSVYLSIWQRRKDIDAVYREVFVIGGRSLELFSFLEKQKALLTEEQNRLFKLYEEQVSSVLGKRKRDLGILNGSEGGLYTPPKQKLKLYGSVSLSRNLSRSLSSSNETKEEPETEESSLDMDFSLLDPLTDFYLGKLLEEGSSENLDYSLE